MKPSVPRDEEELRAWIERINANALTPEQRMARRQWHEKWIFRVNLLALSLCVVAVLILCVDLWLAL